MSKTTEHRVTPSKLISKPPIYSHAMNLIPLKKLLMLPPKTPKLFSSFRTSSVQSRPKSQNHSFMKNIPSFLCEYLNYPEFRSNSVSRQKQRTTQDSYQKPKPEKIEIHEKTSERTIKAITPNPRIVDAHSTKKCETGLFYKPYMIEISPRAKIRLYSPAPILPLNESKSFKKVSKKRYRFHQNCESGLRKEEELRMQPVNVSNYTRSYADKLRKVIEICEAAKEEANFVYS